MWPCGHVAPHRFTLSPTHHFNIFFSDMNSSTWFINPQQQLGGHQTWISSLGHHKYAGRRHWPPNFTIRSQPYVVDLSTIDHLHLSLSFINGSKTKSNNILLYNGVLCGLQYVARRLCFHNSLPHFSSRCIQILTGVFHFPGSGGVWCGLGEVLAGGLSWYLVEVGWALGGFFKEGAVSAFVWSQSHWWWEKGLFHCPFLASPHHP